jgi:hypothetical protein
VFIKFDEQRSNEFVLEHVQLERFEFWGRNGRLGW